MYIYTREKLCAPAQFTISELNYKFNYKKNTGIAEFSSDENKFVEKKNIIFFSFPYTTNRIDHIIFNYYFLFSTIIILIRFYCFFLSKNQCLKTEIANFWKLTLQHLRVRNEIAVENPRSTQDDSRIC